MTLIAMPGPFSQVGGTVGLLCTVGDDDSIKMKGSKNTRQDCGISRAGAGQGARPAVSRASLSLAKKI
jgi:hypothetical protein